MANKTHEEADGVEPSLVRLWLSKGRQYPTTTHYLPEVGTVQLRSWDEEFVYVLAHELQHIADFWGGELTAADLDGQWMGHHLEVRAEKYAVKTLRAWRAANKTFAIDLHNQESSMQITHYLLKTSTHNLLVLRGVMIGATKALLCRLTHALANDTKPSQEMATLKLLAHESMVQLQVHNDLRDYLSDVLERGFRDASIFLPLPIYKFARNVVDNQLQEDSTLHRKALKELQDALIQATGMTDEEVAVAVAKDEPVYPTMPSPPSIQ